MMMLSEVAKALNANMLGADVKVANVGIDSRSIATGQLFFGIKGERFDGNAYASQAVKEGAAAVVVSDAETTARPAVLVDDTRLALGELAHYWRKKFDVPLVAVTGSNGKTTVKEMIAAILGAAGGNVLFTQGNLNNDIGMPLTLLNMRSEHTVAVIEMGMNHENEIRYLSQLALPQVAVVNNAGTAHIGELGSRDAIARAKAEIFEGLSQGGVAVINADDDYADFWKEKNQGKQIVTFGLHAEADVGADYQVQGSRTSIALKTPSGSVQINLNMLGDHNVSNALAAAAVAVALGIPNSAVADGLSQMNEVKGRLTWRQGLNGAEVVDDTYNANPDSMKVAIDVLANKQKQNKVKAILVMGDMGELGEDAEKMHAELGLYASQEGIDCLYTFGELSQLASEKFGSQGKHFESMETLVEVVKNQMASSVTVLVKGSRFMRMERVVEKIIDDGSEERVY